MVPCRMMPFGCGWSGMKPVRTFHARREEVMISTAHDPLLGSLSLYFSKSVVCHSFVHSFFTAVAPLQLRINLDLHYYVNRTSVLSDTLRGQQPLCVS